MFKKALFFFWDEGVIYHYLRHYKVEYDCFVSFSFGHIDIEKSKIDTTTEKSIQSGH